MTLFIVIWLLVLVLAQIAYVATYLFAILVLRPIMLLLCGLGFVVRLLFGHGPQLRRRLTWMD